MKFWDLIIDEEPKIGSWNMSVDEYLLRLMGEELHTYLRFYAWKRPTVSLGYSQVASKVVDVDYCRDKGIDIVRRITGGKLVLHVDEVTYSLCSSDDTLFTSNLSDSYRLVSEALVKGLERMGLEANLADSTPDPYSRSHLPCFSYPAKDEVEIDGKKIIGSAQKRVGKAFLQHGSIPLEKHDDILNAISLPRGKDEPIHMISLSQALRKKVGFTWAVDHFVKGFADYFGIEFNPKIFAPNEFDRITQIQLERHSQPDWIFGAS